jgi:two-component system, chemotaxis family, chemotaxis protein CheY
MRSLNYLVVDDSPTVLKVVSKALEARLGATNILRAADGSEALNMLKTNDIDIILSDWDMPKLSGDELLYEVRNKDEWKDIPFIIMTTHGRKDFIATAMQLGVTQYIVKPFSPDELEDKIRKSWSSSTKRRSTRYAGIPEHRLLLKIDSKPVHAEIVNISRGGMLVKLKYTYGVNLFTKYECSLEVTNPADKHQWIISPLIGRSSRIEAEHSNNASSQLCLMALVFDPSLISGSVEDTLLNFLSWLNSRTSGFIPAE